MSAYELFFITSGLIFIASAVSFFVFRKAWLALAIFGFGWVVVVVKDIVLGASEFDIILDSMIAGIFLLHAVNMYHKDTRAQSKTKEKTSTK